MPHNSKRVMPSQRKKRKREIGIACTSINSAMVLLKVMGSVGRKAINTKPNASPIWSR